MYKSNPEIKVWDKVAEEYKDNIVVEENQLFLEIRNIFVEIGLEVGDEIIELGCGSGHLSVQFAESGYKTTLLDFSCVALEKASKLFDKKGQQGNFVKEDLLKPLQIEGNYKIAWNSGVLEHFDDKAISILLNNVKEINAEYFAFIVPNPKSIPYLLFRYRQMANKSWLYGKEYLRNNYEQLFMNNGLEVINTLYVGGDFSAEHLSAYTNGEDTSFVKELFENEVLEADQKYLVAYILKRNPGKLELDEEVKEKNSMNTEQRTLIFDLISEKDGVEKENKKIKEKNKELDSELREIKYINEELKNTIQELIEIKEEIRHKEDLLIDKTEIITCKNKIIEQLRVSQEEDKEAVQEEIRIFKENEKSQESYIKEISRNLVKVKKDTANKIDSLEAQLKDISKAHSYLETKLANVTSEKDQFSSQLWQIHNSTLWKWALKYYKVRDSIPGIRYFKSRKQEIVPAQQVCIEVTPENREQLIVDIPTNYEHVVELLTLNKEYIVVFPPLVDWNIPLFQRPQHIALNLAELGNTYFYCTTNTYDKTENFDALEGLPNLYLTNQYEAVMKAPVKKVFHMYAQDFNIKKEDVDKILDEGNIILYEYIDALSDQLCTGKENVQERHLAVLQDERCIVVCTASNLYDEVAKYRKNNFMLVTNGVEIKHFTQTFKEEDIPSSIAHVVAKNKPIIGYFGALAKWFDYELVEKLANKHPDYEILLVGWDYDQSLQETSLPHMKNVTIVGPIDYKELPKYAYWFDVSTIPFLINEITLATSPIKLFEYMALGHPIVTTDMPECRKYRSVDIGHTHEEFITNIENALLKKNKPETKDILKKEALENTWLAKARCMNELIKASIDN